jgi:hypothetical protein
MTPELTSRPHAYFAIFSSASRLLCLTNRRRVREGQWKARGKPEAVALDRYCPEQRRGHAVRLTISPALVSRTASDFLFVSVTPPPEEMVFTPV